VVVHVVIVGHYRSDVDGSLEFCFVHFTPVTAFFDHMRLYTNTVIFNQMSLVIDVY